MIDRFLHIGRAKAKCLPLAKLGEERERQERLTHAAGRATGEPRLGVSGGAEPLQIRTANTYALFSSTEKTDYTARDRAWSSPLLRAERGEQPSQGA